MGQAEGFGNISVLQEISQYFVSNYAFNPAANDAQDSATRSQRITDENHIE